MCDGGEALALAADIAHIIKAIQLRSKLNYIPCSGVSESSVYILCVDFTHTKAGVHTNEDTARRAKVECNDEVDGGSVVVSIAAQVLRKCARRRFIQIRRTCAR